LLWICLPSFLILFSLPYFFDRYLLIILPAAIALVLLLARQESPRLAACAAGCLALGALSAMGLRDYFSWNRARWQAGLYGVSLGLAPRQVENGFDWDAQFSLKDNMSALLARKEPAAIDVWDWQKENRIVLLTSFSKRPPRSDFRLLRGFPYRTPLSRHEQAVYLHGYAPALKPRR
jgi:hypothetical protein